jgi:hypothetical protein
LLDPEDGFVAVPDDIVVHVKLSVDHLKAYVSVVGFGLQ